MRRRQATEEIQLLSTSFLDLLCCGLCSVVLLWVLTGSREKSSPDEPFGFAQVGQTGYWHWRATAIAVTSRDGKVKPKPIEMNAGQDGTTIEKQEMEARKHGLTVFHRKGADKGFAGMIILATDRNTADMNVRVSFTPCPIDYDIHAIRVLMHSGSQQAEDAFVYTEAAALERALAPRNAVLRQRYAQTVRRALPVSPGTSGAELRFEVKGGRIRYVPPLAGS